MRLSFLVPGSVPAIKPAAEEPATDQMSTSSLGPPAKVVLALMVAPAAQAVTTQVIAPAKVVAPASKELPVPRPKARNSLWDSSYFLPSECHENPLNSLQQPLLSDYDNST